MYCRGKKVETLVEEQIAEETYKEAAWVEPVIIAVPIAFVFLVAVGTFVGKCCISADSGTYTHTLSTCVLVS